MSEMQPLARSLATSLSPGGDTDWRRFIPLAHKRSTVDHLPSPIRFWLGAGESHELVKALYHNCD